MKKTIIFWGTIILWLLIEVYAYFSLSFTLPILNHVIYIGTHVFLILNIIQTFTGKYTLPKSIISTIVILRLLFCLVLITFLIYLPKFPNNPTELLRYNIPKEKNKSIVLRSSNNDYYELIVEKKYFFKTLKQVTFILYKPKYYYCQHCQLRNIEDIYKDIINICPDLKCEEEKIEKIELFIDDKE